ncbi:MAG: NADH-quinone oxidoreductase subunit L [Microthrixaceae bacterium]
MNSVLWLIPAFPLAGALVLVVFGRRLGDPLAGWLATAASGAAFVMSVTVFASLWSRGSEARVLHQTLFTWIPAGSFKIGMGLLADPLSIAMCLFVTGVGTLIHLYSIGYMKGDEKFSKFFFYLNLFVLSMLMLVLGDNLVVTFLGWEGVGACSYFLVAFWHEDRANATAGKKAFVTNRVGDWGFLVGTFLTWTVVGSVNYLDIADKAHHDITAITASMLVLLFLAAATGKSAQLPLFVWLPDAMAGPTPVSALIHAATMVTSGVYLLIRLHPLIEAASPWASTVVAWVGAITALVAATIAIAQNDIKKVLAYSTVSQLGYLFIAVGTHNYVAAIFHMVTHAFFKALLFLGSGSVILSMEHDQDMRHYGNLRKYLPITAGTFIVAWLAIAGVPPFSGFWSKDEILAGAWGQGTVSGKLLWAVALIAALLTAFYMSRQVFMTFFGEEKWRSLGVDHLDGDGADDSTPDSAHGHHLTPEHTPRESPWTMTVPLIALGVLAAVGGVLNLPFASGTKFLEHWLEPVVGHHDLGVGGLPLVVLAVGASLIALAGIALAAMIYLRRRADPAMVELEPFARGWYIDSAYSAFVAGPGRRIFDAIAWFDRTVVDGAVNGVGSLVDSTSRGLSQLQNGKVRSSAIGIASGAVAIALYVVLRMGS